MSQDLRELRIILIARSDDSSAMQLLRLGNRAKFLLQGRGVGLRGEKRGSGVLPSLQGLHSLQDECLYFGARPIKHEAAAWQQPRLGMIVWRYVTGSACSLWS